MFLGMDGGGTHSLFVLLDGSGRELARHEGGSAYYPEVGMDAVRAMLESGVRAVLAQAGVAPGQVAHAFFGLPMHGEDDQTAVLDQLPAAVLPAGHYTCGNDVVCGWAGSLGGEDGINIVAGTGSIGYGEWGGRSARCGGWGELFSDEGSAYWIAREGLGLFSRMSDGRLPRGPLHRQVRALLGTRADLELGTYVARELGNARSRIAALARLVSAAADEGDVHALALLELAGRELAALVQAIRRSLGVPPGEQVPVSHSGGVFEGCAQVGAAFRAALGPGDERYRLVAPRHPPETGAALQAARLAGTRLAIG